MQAGRTANQHGEIYMMPLTNTTQKKLVEQALMMAIRFRVLMYQRRPDELSARRLRGAMNALNLQLDTFKPSRWMRENFIETSTSFAGYYWQVTAEKGRYFVDLSDKPFPRAVAKKTQLQLIACQA